MLQNRFVLPFQLGLDDLLLLLLGKLENPRRADVTEISLHEAVGSRASGRLQSNSVVHLLPVVFFVLLNRSKKRHFFSQEDGMLGIVGSSLRKAAQPLFGPDESPFIRWEGEKARTNEPLIRLRMQNKGTKSARPGPKQDPIHSPPFPIEFSTSSRLSKTCRSSAGTYSSAC